MAAWEFQQLQTIAEKNGWHKFISMQNYYNLLYREEEREMIPFCNDTGVGIIPWSPLARGVLARPWGTITKREETDQNKLPPGTEEREKEIVKRVEEIAKKRNSTMAAVSTAWVLQKGANPIVGLTSKDRIDQAVEGLGLVLSEEEMSYLAEPYQTRPIIGY